MIARQSLTNRSTGLIAARRHLPRRFILAQMLSHHNAPISFGTMIKAGHATS
jgi:hypothetical protein